MTQFHNGTSDKKSLDNVFNWRVAPKGRKAAVKPKPKRPGRSKLDQTLRALSTPEERLAATWASQATRLKGSI